MAKTKQPTARPSRVAAVLSSIRDLDGSECSDLCDAIIAAVYDRRQRMAEFAKLNVPTGDRRFSDLAKDDNAVDLAEWIATELDEYDEVERSTTNIAIALATKFKNEVARRNPPRRFADRDAEADHRVNKLGHDPDVVWRDLKFKSLSSMQRQINRHIESTQQNKIPKVKNRQNHLS